MEAKKSLEALPRLPGRRLQIWQIAVLKEFIMAGAETNVVDTGFELLQPLESSSTYTSGSSGAAKGFTTSP